MAEIEQPAAAPLQEKEIEPKEGKGTTESLPGQHGLCSAGADGAEACLPSAWSPCSPYGPRVRKLDHKDHTLTADQPFHWHSKSYRHRVGSGDPLWGPTTALIQSCPTFQVILVLP